ncbi:MAG TPA: selenide, water dikinase SelD [Gemmatimonadaceae bacterium]|nr:selenide, water dikinase SelD [Gemmatimonadaceae bacterium]
MTTAAKEDVIRLTQFARCAGCAAKMGPGDLAAALAPLERRSDPRILVGRETFDDAGVYQLSPELALVQTLDFFAPIVDDPYDFGRVAATNALSDVFAMGGEPITAMNIVGFPVGQLPLRVLTDMLRGGQDAVHEAGAHIVGGHTITDEELKYGLSVTGTIHPQRILSNAAARPGDALVLTKAIGTGILSTAAKRGALGATEQAALVKSMTTLNSGASRAAVSLGLHCATDITGFGLLGHASHVARASSVTLVIDVKKIPLLPGTRAALAAGALTGGAARNDLYLEPLVGWGRTTTEERAFLVDPQTSGGLLVAVPAEKLAAYLGRVDGAVQIGDVRERFHSGDWLSLQN